MKDQPLLYICDWTEPWLTGSIKMLAVLFEPTTRMKKPIHIGVTDCGKFENYRRWVEMLPDTVVVKLSPKLQNVADLAKCDGVLFSGGEDVHPGLYGKPEFEQQYDLKEIIPERDHFEFEVLEKTLAAKKPVLGICRGLQIINVFLGGTLIPDIPTLIRSGTHGKIEGTDQTHLVSLIPGTLMAQICGQKEGIVNSAHHQSVDRVAPPLKISGVSESVVVEAMEWKEPAGKSWLLTVQWHPERMDNLQSPFSLQVKTAFLKACVLVPVR
jgi:putative glutamine amidotransferase